MRRSSDTTATCEGCGLDHCAPGPCHRHYHWHSTLLWRHFGDGNLSQKKRLKIIMITLCGLDKQPPGIASLHASEGPAALWHSDLPAWPLLTILLTISVRHFGSTSCFALGQVGFFIHLSHWFWNSFCFSIWRYINHVCYFLNERKKNALKLH